MPANAKFIVWAVVVAAACAAVGSAELADTLAPAKDHPVIAYGSTPSHDPVAELNRKLQSSAVHLNFENGSGYLRSLLQALNIPVESQIAVFSKTSLQLDRINPSNPRTLFFNDSVVIGW